MAKAHNRLIIFLVIAVFASVAVYALYLLGVYFLQAYGVERQAIDLNRQWMLLGSLWIVLLTVYAVLTVATKKRRKRRNISH
jgi:hypothetical protein